MADSFPGSPKVDRPFSTPSEERIVAESKFTPGPWKAAGTSVDAGDVHEDGVRVAKCWTSTFAPPREESAANARLIAAAPDMLAVCEALCDPLRVSTLKEVIRQAAEALAKVKGP